MRDNGYWPRVWEAMMTIEPSGEGPDAAEKHDRLLVIWRVDRAGPTGKVGGSVPAPMPVRQDGGPNAIALAIEVADPIDSDPITALSHSAAWPRVFPGL
jgi:hypothetical protein